MLRTSGISPGCLFFGYFLLAKQKKVTRLRVREPGLNKRRASDTLTLNQYKSDQLRNIS
jgi:hypothetical protein